MSKIVVANWKMNPQSVKEAENLFKEILKIAGKIKSAKIIVCPPFPFLFISQKLKNKKIIIGAQNVSVDESGSHTGEVSPDMISSMGARYVIVGHGESRGRGENNEIINKKILNLIKFKLSPILCVGESNRDKEAGYLSFLEEQIKVCLVGVPKSQMKNIMIAYEPLWAIGAGAQREATKEEFMEIKIFIRKIISDIYDSKTAHSVPVLYGGSVSSLNASYFANEGGADGLLVGRDSLSSKKFEGIVNAIK